MIAFLSLVLHVLVSPLKSQARLEAEIIMLRHQLNVLRRRIPSKPKLATVDRLHFVWLYGRRLSEVIEPAASCLEVLEDPHGPVGGGQRAEHLRQQL